MELTTRLRNMLGILRRVTWMVNGYQQFCLSTGSFPELHLWIKRLSGERSPHMMLPGWMEKKMVSGTILSLKRLRHRAIDADHFAWPDM